MTVSAQNSYISYTGTGSVTEYSFPYKVFASANIKVYTVVIATGVETLQTAGGSGTYDYTISIESDYSGGLVTLSNTLPATHKVFLTRVTDLEQAQSYIEGDSFPATAHEQALDKLSLQVQQHQEQLRRTFKLSQSNSGAVELAAIATDRDSKTLGFDSSGDLTTVADFLPAGGDSALFKYSDTTADADPGAGLVRFNHGTLSSATIIYIDDADNGATDVSAWVQSFDDVTGTTANRGRIRVQKASDLTIWHVYRVNAAVTDASGYTKVPVTYIDGAGTLVDEDKIFISFVASGDDGTIPGYLYNFDTSTTDADPGAGDIRFNNGTYASATAIYIDDADANGVTTQADTETWGDSTETIKGYLHIVDRADVTTYARFKITAAVTDASGYNKITVVHLASNNTFSAAD